MAREAMVTRTIKTTEVLLMVVDMESCEVKNIEVIVSGSPKNEDALFTSIEKDFKKESSKYKPIKIMSTKVNEELYGMSEVEFVKSAKVLPPRTANK